MWDVFANEGGEYGAGSPGHRISSLPVRGGGCRRSRPLFFFFFSGFSNLASRRQGKRVCRPRSPFLFFSPSPGMPPPRPIMEQKGDRSFFPFLFAARREVDGCGPWKALASRVPFPSFVLFSRGSLRNSTEVRGRLPTNVLL